MPRSISLESGRILVKIGHGARPRSASPYIRSTRSVPLHPLVHPLWRAHRRFYTRVFLPSVTRSLRHNSSRRHEHKYYDRRPFMYRGTDPCRKVQEKRGGRDLKRCLTLRGSIRATSRSKQHPKGRTPSIPHVATRDDWWLVGDRWAFDGMPLNNPTARWNPPRMHLRP